MASFLGVPAAGGPPSKKGMKTAPAWNDDLSDGDESTYTYKVPDDDGASQASTHASRASSTAEW
eukprot:11943741-Alexandrium_andersonii.AAC.1